MSKKTDRINRCAYDINDHPYNDLANAIIAQAANDYRVAKKKRDKSEIKFITDFFYSGWYSMLTKVDPDYILGRL